MSAISRPSDYPRFKTNNRWRSIDAHFQNGAGSVSLSLLHMNAAYTSFMNVCIQLPLRSPKMQEQKSLTRRWLSFSGWARERFSLVFGYKGAQCIRKGQQYMNVNILRLAIGYLNETINRTTWKPEPEIPTDGTSQTWQHQQADWFRSGFGPPRCSGSGFWMGLEPNRTVLVVWTRTAGGLPRPVTNTTHSWNIEILLMVHHGKRGESAGYGMVRTSGHKYLKLQHGFLCGKLPVKSAEMQCTYVIHHANDMYGGGS